MVSACSGLGYLFNALGLGVIFSYFFQRRAWKVALLLLSMIPFAIVANASRLACIGIWPIFEKGLWHASFGLSIFIVGFDYLKGVNWLLNYAAPPLSLVGQLPAADSLGSSAALSIPALASPSIPTWPQACSSSCWPGPWAIAGVESVPVPLKQSFDHFPMQLGPWKGRQVQVDPEMVAATGADTVLNADFMNPDSGPGLLVDCLL